MNVQFSADHKKTAKCANRYSKEPATRVNLALLQPSGFVQGIAGVKHRFQSAIGGEETVVEVFADTDQNTNAVEMHSYINSAKLALR